MEFVFSCLIRVVSFVFGCFEDVLRALGFVPLFFEIVLVVCVVRFIVVPLLARQSKRDKGE